MNNSVAGSQPEEGESLPVEVNQHDDASFATARPTGPDGPNKHSEAPPGLGVLLQLSKETPKAPVFMLANKEYYDPFYQIRFLQGHQDALSKLFNLVANRVQAVRDFSRGQQDLGSRVIEQLWVSSCEALCLKAKYWWTLMLRLIADTLMDNFA
ncbi:MAG: hypothetical protein Q9201_000414 [Fulgogasparrea decipioides]